MGIGLVGLPFPGRVRGRREDFGVAMKRTVGWLVPPVGTIVRTGFIAIIAIGHGPSPIFLSLPVLLISPDILLPFESDDGSKADPESCLLHLDGPEGVGSAGAGVSDNVVQGKAFITTLEEVARYRLRSEDSQ